MVLAIIGKNATREYTGSNITYPDSTQTDETDFGYTVIETSATGLFDASLVTCEKQFSATGKELGSYAMGINPSMFGYGDSNINCLFVLLNDGFLTIKAADITKCSISSTDYTYDGNIKTANLTVRTSGESSVVLKQGIDFTVAGITTATDSGTYYVNISGINNYEGTIYDTS